MENNCKRVGPIAWVLLLTFLCGRVALAANKYNENLFKGMKWRSIGPFRGGRVLAVTGVPGDPYTFYFGGVAGGDLPRTDGGTNGTPPFDTEQVSPICGIAVSHPRPALS